MQINSPARNPAAFTSPVAITPQLHHLSSPNSVTAVTTRGNHVTLPRRSNPHSQNHVTMTAFRKYHGLGNDFVLIDNRQSLKPILTPEQSVAVCDRHTGVGADGVIFLLPAQNSGSDVSMRLYNSDGTEPEMCGNGIRCLARFAADLSVESQTDGTFVVDTLAGPIVPELLSTSDHVRVDMGAPILTSGDIPTTLNTNEENQFTDVIPDVIGKDWNATCVSMGNPHAIIFVNENTYADLDSRLESVGPSFENNPVFPQRTNTEFVQAHSETEFDMLVWERGSGRTRACGTGACAVLVAAVLTGRARKDTPTVVHLPGGDLVIEWVSETDHILMTGPAELVFQGQLSNM